MTDAEISRRLALAIGYKREDVDNFTSRTVAVWHHTGPKNSCQHWYCFDYRDPAVIWPIAEAYNCFPQKLRAVDLWSAPVPGTLYPRVNYEFADTAAKAVALAVIKHHEGSKT